jgi:mono/diheme cytochrome c family protein
MRTMSAVKNILILALWALGATAAPDLEQHPGKGIYKRLCTECHGSHGEPVKDHADESLTGNRDLSSLGRRDHQDYARGRGREVCGR